MSSARASELRARQLECDCNVQDHHIKGAEVFVGGLARSVTEDMILEVFSQCGVVVQIRLKKEPNGISKGFCFVRFSDKESASRAVKEKNGTKIQGKEIGVSLSLEQDTLFFGNLRKDWTAEEFDRMIRMVFEGILSVDLAMHPNSVDPSTGRKRLNRGFAFVRFSSHGAAARAHRIGSKADFLLDGGLHPAIDWAEKEAMDPDDLAKIKTAFVGNLPKNANEGFLRILFEPFGKVEKVALSRKGHVPVGFVHFTNRGEVNNAIKEMNGKMIKGPNGGPYFEIQVSIARPVENDRKRVREEEKAQPGMRVRQSTYTADVQVPAASDSYEAAIIELRSTVKERLLRILRLGIATRYDIDIHAISSLNSLSESAASAVLDQFLLSGGEVQDKGQYFDFLIAKHGVGKYGKSPSLQHPKDDSLPRRSKVHRLVSEYGNVEHQPTVVIAPDCTDRHSTDTVPSVSQYIKVPRPAEAVLPDARYMNLQHNAGPVNCASRYIRDASGSLYPSHRKANPDLLHDFSPAAAVHFHENDLARPSRGFRVHQELREELVLLDREPRRRQELHEELVPLDREPRRAIRAEYAAATSTPAPKMAAEYTPPQRKVMRFDPFTGEPYKFDPFTGEPILPEPNPRPPGGRHN